VRHACILARKTVVALCVLGTLAALAANPGRTRTAHAATAGPTAHVAVAPSRASGSLGPLINIPQAYNNCGPTSVAEVLAYWGVQRTQYQTAAVLRADDYTPPGSTAYGMSTFGLPAYARGLGLRALIGVGGTQPLLKALVSNGFPVIVNQPVSLADHDAHYRPIDAYDDRQGVFVSSDPYLGQGHAITYPDFARLWSRGTRFVVLYPPARAPLLTATLAAAGWDKTRAYRHALSQWSHRRTLPPGVPAPTYSRAEAAYYRYASLAWDDLELGRYADARVALRRASADTAPIVVHWIDAEIHWRAAGNPA